MRACMRGAHASPVLAPTAECRRLTDTCPPRPLQPAAAPAGRSWACTLCTASEGGYGRDCLIVAGDVSDSLDTLEMTLTLFQGSFKHVFFTPGNHGEPLS